MDFRQPLRGAGGGSHDAEPIHVPFASCGVRGIARGPRLSVNTAWRFETASDFDGDGADEVLIRNRDDGRWSLSLMAGVQPKAAGLLDLFSNRQLVLEETADYNGDGRQNILLRHVSANCEVIRWVL